MHDIGRDIGQPDAGASNLQPSVFGASDVEQLAHQANSVLHRTPRAADGFELVLRHRAHR